MVGCGMEEGWEGERLAQVPYTVRTFSVRFRLPMSEATLESRDRDVSQYGCALATESRQPW